MGTSSFVGEVLVYPLAYFGLLTGFATPTGQDYIDFEITSSKRLIFISNSICDKKTAPKVLCFFIEGINPGVTGNGSPLARQGAVVVRQAGSLQATLQARNSGGGLALLSDSEQVIGVLLVKLGAQAGHLSL